MGEDEQDKSMGENGDAGGLDGSAWPARASHRPDGALQIIQSCPSRQAHT